MLTIPFAAIRRNDGQKPSDHELGSPRYAELFAQCKIFAYAHHVILRPAPAKFITTFLEEAFQEQCDTYQRTKCQQYLRALITSAIFFVMPMVYGYSLMEYPCKETEILLGSNSTQLSHHFAKLDVKCRTQDLIRSPWSLVLGPTAYVIGRISFAFILKAAGRWRSCFGSCGMLVYAMALGEIRRFLPKLIVQPSRGPGSYEYPTMVFYAILVEMVVVAMLLRSAVAAVIAVFLGRAWLVLCNIVFAVDPIWAHIVEAELARFGAPSYTVLLRIFHGPVRSTAWVSENELAALWGNAKLRQAVEDDEFPVGFSAQLRLNERVVPFDRIPIFLSQIYIPDSDLKVDMVKGSIHRGPECLWPNLSDASCAESD